MQQPTTLTQADLDLNDFRCAFPYMNCTSYENYMVYGKLPFGYVDGIVKEAQEVIKQLGLNLEVESNASNGVFTDSMIVRAIN